MARVHIVGAGPAGSIAAMSALRSGHDVVVSEDHPAAGIPENCSGLFSIDGLNTLSDFIDYRRFATQPIRGADIHLADQKLSVRRKKPVGFVCDRAAMDQALASRAETEGAKMNYCERISNRFHADNIIGTDGPLSSVARHFRFNPIKRHVSTLQAVLPYMANDPGVVEVFLSNTRFPGFFAWVVPRNECTAEFGVGVELPHKPLESWKRLLRLKSVQNAPRPKGAVIPIETRPQTAIRLGKRNVLLAGDAAGQVKSTTGGGVIFGGNCGALAGRHATNPKRYDMEWRLRYGPDLAMHLIIHDYLASMSDREMSAFGRRLKKLDCDSYLSHHGHMDRPTRMIGPAILLHLLKNMAGVA
ncbi:NAD(P)/FAD-dependent oxidoreductase [Candidatus Micrarchaeota archaeon]|nr:NAD(P)/FAD-dependent oxidoreductase [Candidatus Micrarchaeota archaeon]